MNLTNLKKRLLSNIDFRKEYELKNEKELAIRVGAKIQALRVHTGLTQIQLAEAMQTQQPNIARIESGKKLPSLKTLHKIAMCAGTYLIEPDFAILQESRMSRNETLHFGKGFAYCISTSSENEYKSIPSQWSMLNQKAYTLTHS